MTGALGITLLNCNGDAGKGASCKLPLGVGSLSLEPIKFPIAKGTITGIPKVDLTLSAALPSSMAKTTTTITAAAKNGDKMFCVKVMTAPAATLGATVAVKKYTPLEEMLRKEKKVNAATLNLTWKDCGDSSTHAKVTDVEPKSLQTGAKTTITGTGILDEEVDNDATFTMKMTGALGITLLNCNGDAAKGQTCKLP